ncbi:putative glycosidase crf1 [Smittium culicis]|uniref:Putative glycosidase crf1 n=1 Tax=Smittium culicis TaxID=133412 RepID=A0A1R1XCZ7_9FUNG|nr:putative glycosidase crf1 [Smittium culicis]OMJ12502.1 putative glycosidase crf1 [Smittium culicis]
MESLFKNDTSYGPSKRSILSSSHRLDNYIKKSVEFRKYVGLDSDEVDENDLGHLQDLESGESYEEDPVSGQSSEMDENNSDQLESESLKEQNTEFSDSGTSGDRINDSEYDSYPEIEQEYEPESDSESDSETSLESSSGCRTLNKKCNSVSIDFSSETADSYFDIPYCNDNISYGDEGIELRVSNQCSTTLIYKSTFKYGLVEGIIKAAPNSGSVTAFILLDDDSKDEIDFEWLGKDPSSVQSMFFINGIPANEGPQYHPSSSASDTSTEFVNYAIELLPHAVNWYVDNELVRSVERESDSSFPANANNFRFGVWDGSGVSDWAGSGDHDQTISKAYFKSIEITEYCFE